MIHAVIGFWPNAKDLFNNVPDIHSTKLLISRASGACICLCPSTPVVIFRPLTFSHSHLSFIDSCPFQILLFISFLQTYCKGKPKNKQCFFLCFVLFRFLCIWTLNSPFYVLKKQNCPITVKRKKNICPNAINMRLLLLLLLFLLLFAVYM